MQAVANMMPPVAARLHELVRLRNREIKLGAMMQLFLGIVFSFLTFGFLFWGGWLTGWLTASYLPLRPWQLGALVAGLFMIVATWSAWRHVDPLAGLQRMTDQQWLLTQLSLATPSVLYFSPRHALAGSAVVLLAGPVSVFQAMGQWAHRLRADQALIEEAALLLGQCSDSCPLENITAPEAALLLRRLALITAMPQADSVAFSLTQKGEKILSKGKKKRKVPAQ